MALDRYGSLASGVATGLASAIRKPSEERTRCQEVRWNGADLGVHTREHLSQKLLLFSFGIHSKRGMFGQGMV